MPASEFKTLLQRWVAATCATSIGFSGLPQLAIAAELSRSPAPGLLLTEPPTELAQANRSRQRQRPEPRPQAHRPPGHHRRGSAAGALTRPAPGFDRGNRRPASGWLNNTPPGSLKPRPAPLRPRPGMGNSFDRPRPDGTKPSWNRPDWNRPGGNRPDWNRPGANRPDWNRPGTNRPDWNRPDWNRPGGNRPNWNRPGWNRPDWVFVRPVQINTINVRPRWWGPGWSSARPWRYGWYNGGYDRWNWWNGSSLAWGITSLASAAIIAAAINNALQQDQPTIAVQDSPYQLVFGSVHAVNADEVVFNFLFGEASYEARANCRTGTLNGRKPQNPEEAQLMNAACQVAFSTF